MRFGWWPVVCRRRVSSAFDDRLWPEHLWSTDHTRIDLIAVNSLMWSAEFRVLSFESFYFFKFCALPNSLRIHWMCHCLRVVLSLLLPVRVVPFVRPETDWESKGYHCSIGYHHRHRLNSFLGRKSATFWTINMQQPLDIHNTMPVTHFVFDIWIGTRAMLRG